MSPLEMALRLSSLMQISSSSGFIIYNLHCTEKVAKALIRRNVITEYSNHCKSVANMTTNDYGPAEKQAVLDALVVGYGSGLNTAQNHPA
uniref:Iso_dh domain-containing protein n=1 Tax=Heterorhabditis bacteriophora TaxID=37862 RepID=A0A1I7X5X9_HETBA